MGKPKKKDLPDLAHLARPGQLIELRATPKAARNAITISAEGIKVTVTEAPEAGKANEAIRSLLARAMGVAASHLDLHRGAVARNKVFVYRGEG